MRRVDGTLAVNGLAKRVNDSTEHCMANGDIHDAARGADLVALLDGVNLTKENGTDLFLVEVLSKTVDGLAGDGARKLEKLASHRGLETRDVSDTVAHLGNDRRLLLVNRGVDLRKVFAQRAQNHLGADLVCH